MNESELSKELIDAGMDPTNGDLLKVVQDLMAAAVQTERQRCVDLINGAREIGETDLRQVRVWIQAGYEVEDLDLDNDGAK